MNLVVLAALLQLGSIVLRGIAAQRWPLGNMYEFISAITFAAVLTWLVVLKCGTGLRPLGAVRAAPGGDPAVPRPARCSTPRPRR